MNLPTCIVNLTSVLLNLRLPSVSTWYFAGYNIVKSLIYYDNPRGFIPGTLLSDTVENRLLSQYFQWTLLIVNAWFVSDNKSTLHLQSNIFGNVILIKYGWPLCWLVGRLFYVISCRSQSNNHNHIPVFTTI